MACRCQWSMAAGGQGDAGGLSGFCRVPRMLGGSLWMLGGLSGFSRIPWMLGGSMDAGGPVGAAVFCGCARQSLPPGCWKPVAAEGPWLLQDPNLIPPRPHRASHPSPAALRGRTSPSIRPLTQPGRVVPRGEQFCLPTSCDTAGTEPAPPGHGQGTAPECLGTPGQPGHGQLGGPR